MLANGSSVVSIASSLLTSSRVCFAIEAIVESSDCWKDEEGEVDVGVDKGDVEGRV